MVSFLFVLYELDVDSNSVDCWLPTMDKNLSSEFVSSGKVLLVYFFISLYSNIGYAIGILNCIETKR